MKTISLLLAGLLLAGCGQAPEDTSTITSPQRDDIPYVFDGRLHVAGVAVPGEWTAVSSGGDTWVAHRSTPERREVAWGSGTDVHPLPDALGAWVSPDGSRIAWTQETGPLEGVVHVEDVAAGEPLAARFDIVLPAVNDRTSMMSPVAFTADGRLFLAGEDGQLLWDPATDARLRIRGADGGGVEPTPDGTRWVHFHNGGRSLARVGPDGTVVDEQELAFPEGFAGPAGTWVLQGDRHAMVGDTHAAGVFLVARPDGTGRRTLRPPVDWLFDQWHWIDADTVLVDLLASDGRTGLARCDLAPARCDLVHR